MKSEKNKEADKSFTIHDLPVTERPRERLQRFGTEALSAQELLAVLMGRGIAGESVMVTAQRLLSQFGTVKGIACATVEELAGIKGIGTAKACQLKAAFELAARMTSPTENEEKPVVKTPEDAVAVMQGRLKDKKKEYFVALLLDTRNQLIKIAEISIGSLDSSIVHPREVFKEAISASSASVVFIHNHPSWDTRPSDEDIQMTKRLVQVGELVGIDVLDHVIIGGKNYLSLKRTGLI